MSAILKNGFCCSKLISRGFSCTSSSYSKKWRVSQGLSANRNADGPLLDGPDYTYLDGRPTPLLHKQKQRMLKQREYADTIVNLSSELDFAKERYQNILTTEQQEREQIISNRLKLKGRALNKK